MTVILHNAKDLEKYELRARDGKIGHVRDFFFDEQQWRVRYLIVDTGTWLESREVLISPVAIRQIDAGEETISVELTREQVQQSPSIDRDQPVSREHEAALTQYYNWPSYWGATATGFPDIGFAMPVPISPAGMTRAKSTGGAGAAGAAIATAPADAHLRSVRAVSQHSIEAVDGSIGHVHDFLIDEASWAIRYLVVDTRIWWPGRKVLISPQWIDDVGWSNSKVRVGLTRQAVKESPPFDPANPPTSDYAGQLHDHYGRPRYTDE
jgi:hypothetical protein